MNAGSKVFELRAHFDGQHRFADQIRDVRSYHAYPKDDLAFGISDDFDKAIGGVQRERPPQGTKGNFPTFTV